MTERRQREARVELVCGPGVDPKFDQLISALGHIARLKPKPLIDTIMLWRKAKSEDAAQHRSKLANVSNPCTCLQETIILTVEGSTGTTPTTANASPSQY
jgi:hypothetical protein